MKPVLILGAGINGCAVARDLAINGVPVVLVDRHDIAYGATSRSSRLIHGGLRYLEHRDIALVRESLAERERLLKLAPQFVRPLRLAIPISNRLGGLLTAGLNYVGLGKTKLANWLQNRRDARGLWAVRTGLALYDSLAVGSSLARRSVSRTASSSPQPGDDKRDESPQSETNERPALAKSTRWVCEYSDAQMEFPERFCLALLQDAQAAADEQGVEFQVLTRHECVVQGDQVSVRPVADVSPAGHKQPIRHLDPSVMVNATGASGDRTISSLGVEHPQMFAGTKGTHLFTTNARLKAAIGEHGVYAEAPDGRFVFILPCSAGVLIGTTDEHFQGVAEEACPTAAEIEYLKSLVQSVFPSVELAAADIEMAHSGVRPLPRVDSKRPSDIPRGHTISRTKLGEISVLTLIGGKLTTCRSLAEQVSNVVLRESAKPRQASTIDRSIPGAIDWPATSTAVAERNQQLAEEHQLSIAQVQAVVALCGNRMTEIFSTDTASERSSSPQNPVTKENRQLAERKGRESLIGTNLPLVFVRWSINHEWVVTLDDLVERRLALVFHADLSRSTLIELTRLLVAANKLASADARAAVETQEERLRRLYSKTVLPDVVDLAKVDFHSPTNSSTDRDH